MVKAGYDKEAIKAIIQSGSKGFLQYAQTQKLTTSEIKGYIRAIKQAQQTIVDAQNGKITRARGYHGRLSSDLEQAILSHPDSVYVTTGSNVKYIFRKGNDIVVTAGPGSGWGAIITSYGPDGPRGNSGSSIYGGSPNDPGFLVTDDMIRNGKIPNTGGGTFPPAIPIS